MPSAVPVLPVADLVRPSPGTGASASRCGGLRPHGYAILGFEGTELHLAEHAERRRPPRRSRAATCGSPTPTPCTPAGWPSAPARSPRSPTSPTASASSPPRTSTATCGGSASPIRRRPARRLPPPDADRRAGHRPSPTGGRAPSPPTADPAPADRAGVGLAPTAAPGTDDDRWSPRRRRRACAGCGLADGELPPGLAAQVRDEVHASASCSRDADDDAVRRRPAPARGRPWSTASTSATC